MEIIESFVTDNTSNGLPFYVELAGITFPDASYEISRENSWINVLEYVIDGCGTVEINGKKFDVKGGDVYFLPQGSNHRYYASKEKPFKKIWMNIGGELCTRIVQAYNLTGRYYFYDAPLYPLFERFLQQCKNRESDIRITFDKCSFIFLEIIQQLFSIIQKTSSVNEYAAAAKHFCDSNIYEKITVSDVAEKVNLSVSQLNRLFQKEYTVTVYAYVLSTKINTAKTLLNSTSLDVNEIAFMLKFSDEHYFTNIFKQKTGVTPTEWRRRGKKITN